MERVSSIRMGAAISNFALKMTKITCNRVFQIISICATLLLFTPAILIISQRLHSFDHA